jgi:hypothetical protein
MSRKSQSPINQSVNSSVPGSSPFFDAADIREPAPAGSEAREVAPPEAPPAEGSGDDPFDQTFENLKKIRISDVFASGSVAEKLITSYSVRKPKKNAFFRVNSDPDYEVEAYLYVVKDEGGLEKETYLINTQFALRLDPEILGVFSPSKLYLAIERHAEKPFVWPIRFPAAGAKDNDYWRSARAHAETAKKKWIRIEAKEGSYVRYDPLGKLPEPTWPKVPFLNILRLAFKDRVITDPEHPVIRELYGHL